MNDVLCDVHFKKSFGTLYQTDIAFDYIDALGKKFMDVNFLNNWKQKKKQIYTIYELDRTNLISLVK